MPGVARVGGSLGVLEAAFWGLAGASTLLVGALLAMAFPWPRRVIGLVAGFGAGALISAVTLDLTASAFEAAGIPAVTVGLALGAAAFSIGNVLIHRGGPARHRKRSHGRQKDDPLGILLGTILDGIPESVVIGISLLAGEGASVAVIVAVFLSNVPEAISASADLLRGGWTKGKVLGMWSVVVAASVLAAGLGYVALEGASGSWIAAIQAFAAGSILTMLADAMIPEAFEFTGHNKSVGLTLALGFAVSAALSFTT
jgi:ZIP family zinc transporter